MLESWHYDITNGGKITRLPKFTPRRGLFSVPSVKKDLHSMEHYLNKCSKFMREKNFPSAAYAIKHLLTNGTWFNTHELIQERNPSIALCVREHLLKQKVCPDMRTHSNERPFSCTTCQKAFKAKSDLLKHTRSHDGTKKPFLCNICGKIFSSESGFTYHMCSHTGDKPFQCTICNKSFTGRWQLSHHMQFHLGYKPLNCLMCEKVFADKTGLTDHIWTHTGEKPFQCTFCDKAFNVKGNLSRHTKIHTREEPFKCSVCNKTFNQTGNLTKHMWTHARNSLQWTMCNKVFIWNKMFSKDWLMHTEERPFHATLCHPAFMEKKYFISARHVWAHFSM